MPIEYALRLLVEPAKTDAAAPRPWVRAIATA
jgi:hypothetical protein